MVPSQCSQLGGERDAGDQSGMALMLRGGGGIGSPGCSSFFSRLLQELFQPGSARRSPGSGLGGAAPPGEPLPPARSQPQLLESTAPSNKSIPAACTELSEHSRKPPRSHLSAALKNPAPNFGVCSLLAKKNFCGCWLENNDLKKQHFGNLVKENSSQEWKGKRIVSNSSSGFPNPLTGREWNLFLKIPEDRATLLGSFHYKISCLSPAKLPYLD